MICLCLAELALDKLLLASSKIYFFTHLNLSMLTSVTGCGYLCHVCCRQFWLITSLENLLNLCKSTQAKKENHTLSCFLSNLERLCLLLRIHLFCTYRTKKMYKLIQRPIILSYSRSLQSIISKLFSCKVFLTISVKERERNHFVIV